MSTIENSVYPAAAESIARGAALLRAGELVAFPTETVYGLGANALDERAVKKIFEAKGRPATNPIIVHLASVNDLASVVDPLALAQKRELIDRLAGFWPGPLTLVLPKRPEISDLISAGRASVGVRVPNHPVAQALLLAAKLPIAAPSANLSNLVSPTTAVHVAESFAGKLALILDGGPCAVGIESTVLSLLADTPEILRPGGVTREELEARIGSVLVGAQAASSAGPALSPGQLREHYAPKTPLQFRSTANPELAKLSRLGRIAFSPRSLVGDPNTYSETRVLSQSGDLNEVASQLFAAIRELDGYSLDCILIDSCPEEGIGSAIMDRLRRATAAFKGIL